MEVFDVIIIGFGKGGKTLAAEFSKHNKKVAVIERSTQMYGGTCINIGCIPTKTLVHQAKLASEMQMNSFAQKQAFYAKAIQIKESVVETLRDKNYHNLADNPNITVFNGIGSFVSPKVVRVSNLNGEILLQSDIVIINTGAETIVPPIEGVKENP
ncbi:MAG: FAD-dependent oxidoreductase, partial [Tannerellaceae bacterium]